MQKAQNAPNAANRASRRPGINFKEIYNPRPRRAGQSICRQFSYISKSVTPERLGMAFAKVC
jgi:hypothetical protein